MFLPPRLFNPAEAIAVATTFPLAPARVLVGKDHHRHLNRRIRRSSSLWRSTKKISPDATVVGSWVSFELSAVLVRVSARGLRLTNGGRLWRRLAVPASQRAQDGTGQFDES